MKKLQIWRAASMAGLIINPLLYKCLLMILLLCSRTCFVESQSCRSTQEATDVKTYRAPIVVEGEILDRHNTSVRIKVKRDCKKLSDNALKGERITISGFGSFNPCVEELSQFNTGTNYMFYINVSDSEVNTEFQLTGNPDTADKKVRKIVKSTANNGGPPKLTNIVKPKKLAENDEFLAKCAATGNPLPDITWKKDNQTVVHNSLNGLRIRTKIKKKSSSQLRIKRVKEAIHEGTYTCVVNNHVDPPILSSATLDICALPCENGELNKKRCRCICEDGWEGESCNVRTCALECGVGETFDRDSCQCQCRDGFSLESGTCVPVTTPATDDSCRTGIPCQNGGTCREVQEADGSSSYQCSCRRDLTGPRCETTLCEKVCVHGTLDSVNCACDCQANFTGSTCQTPVDTHVDGCPERYRDYCLNGGTCHYITDLAEPSCFCQPMYRGSPRCSLHKQKPTDEEEPPQIDFSISANSKKIIICMAIIFVTLLIVVGLLLLAYIKNKNAREREIQERIRLRMGAPRPKDFSLATVPATSIELQQYRRPSAPHPQRHQSDSDLGTMQGTVHSRSVDGRIGHYGSGSLKQNNHTPNGHTRMVSQTSLQSARSNGSLRSGERANSVGQKPPGKSGYETVPMDDPEELETPRIQVVDEEIPRGSATTEGEPKTAKERRERRSQEPLSTETESEMESNSGDVTGDRVDDLNPQLEALQSHPALIEEQETEESVAEYSSDLGYSVNPYGMESPVHKAPHRTTRNRLQGSNGQPRHMGIYSNPMEGAYGPRSTAPTSQAIDIQDETGYYAQRLRDVVENSPPSAV
ncbi:uncharacterized protein [Apostichopus japonicus]|uniref:uncharacterized protein isoform X3 n=1 Tax=Stichopus japonicus TaxID=307972 RepID=UPI003AB1BDB0